MCCRNTSSSSIDNFFAAHFKGYSSLVLRWLVWLQWGWERMGLGAPRSSSIEEAPWKFSHFMVSDAVVLDQVQLFCIRCNCIELNRVVLC